MQNRRILDFHVAYALVGTLLIFSLPLAAQESRASIQGRVTDASGAVVPNAAILVTNAKTNVAIKTASNGEGSYQVPFLIPGQYVVSAAAAGFKTATRDDIELRVGDRVQVDFLVEIGASSEQIKVTDEAPLLQTATSNVGMVIDSRRISDLPLPHGSPYSLLYLSPGMIMNNQANGQQLPHVMGALTSYMSINGAPPGSTEFTMDGVPNTQSSNVDYGSGVSNSPPADMVQEFKMETAYDASSGHTSGTIVNVSLKTGANQPHGTAYLAFRQPDWNANNFFANREGQARPDFTYKRWGGTFTGPVILPKLYNGKDRTFFSYGYEALHYINTYAYTGSVPDPKNEGGDFSNLLTLGAIYQIYDPDTIQPAADGRYSRSPIPGNIIPANRISPIAKKILAFYPTPNNTENANGQNNYRAANRPSPETYYNHLARIDHNLSDKQRLFLRVAFMHRVTGPYRDNWDSIAVGQTAPTDAPQIALDDVYVFSPSLVMNIRYGYERYAFEHRPRTYGYDPAQLGFSGDTLAQLSSRVKIFPRVDVAGLATLGGEEGDRTYNDVHSLFVNFTKQHSNHVLKFGMDARAYRVNAFSYGYAGGDFRFNQDYTNGPLDNSPTAPGGSQSLAALLLGRPSGGYVNYNDSSASQSTYWAGYLHDSWRVFPKLTLDLGLRWEYEGPMTERYNRAVRGFDTSVVQPIDAQARANYALNPDPALAADGLHARGALTFAGLNGQPRELLTRQFTMFAPRIGFAYHAAPRVAFRGGFGVFPIELGVPASATLVRLGYSQATNLIPTLNNGQSWSASLANPFPDGLLTPIGASKGLQTNLGNGVYFVSPSGDQPYSARWNFNIQTMLPWNVMLETGYTGSKALRLRAWHDLNPVPVQYLSTSPVRDQTNLDWLSANVRNPFQGLLPGTSLNGETISRSQLLTPYPEFQGGYGGIYYQDSQGYSWYHALQVRAERRMAQGITAQISYSYSKNMEATQYQTSGVPVPYRTVAELDRPHQFSFSGIVELPFGHGRRLLGNVNRWADLFVGGWQSGAVYMYTSGEPAYFEPGNDVMFNGNFNSIVLPSSQRTLDRWFNTGAGFERDPAKQYATHLRTWPLRISGLRSGPNNTLDLSLVKHFRIRERYEGQYRVEAFNALNHLSGLQLPDLYPTDSSFGQVTGASYLPRNIQMSLRFAF